jgi:hypothetical protein
VSKVSVVIPTIQGREELLANSIRAYEETSNDSCEVIIVSNRPTCGIAWQEGSEQATGDYLHFSADDIEPLPGWLEAACAAVDALQVIPSPRVLRPDGTLESCVRWETEGENGDEPDICRIPFMSMAQWEQFAPMIPLHYYTDNWFTYQARKAGYRVEVCRDYAFVHHRPPTLRAGEQRQMIHDQQMYERYVRDDSL